MLLDLLRTRQSDIQRKISELEDLEIKIMMYKDDLKKESDSIETILKVNMDYTKYEGAFDFVYSDLLNRAKTMKPEKVKIPRIKKQKISQVENNVVKRKVDQDKVAYRKSLDFINEYLKNNWNCEFNTLVEELFKANITAHQELKTFKGYCYNLVRDLKKQKLVYTPQKGFIALKN